VIHEVIDGAAIALSRAARDWHRDNRNKFTAGNQHMDLTTGEVTRIRKRGERRRYRRAGSRTNPAFIPPRILSGLRAGEFRLASRLRPGPF